MAITVRCACGKSFAVQEQYAGKKGRCPVCQKVVTVPTLEEDLDIPLAPSPIPTRSSAPAAGVGPEPATDAAVPPKVSVARGGTRFDPAAAAARKAQASPSSPRFTFSPRAILFISLLIGIPIIIAIVKAGPVSAFDEYQKLEPQIEMWTNDALQKVLNEEFKGVVFEGIVRPPKVTNIMIDSPIMMWSLPDEVFVQGETSEGKFKGHYFTQTKRLKLDMGLEYGSRTVQVDAHVDGETLVLDGYK